MSWRPRDFNMRQILPSDYQVELVGRAICQNTIIPLSKNDSKIFVSIQLIKEYSYRLMRNHEKAVLLVNSVSLLEERATQIEFHSSLKVLRIGAGFSDNKSELIKESQVLVISPQIFLGLLNKKAVDLKMVALLILDDCHHCLIGSHPYCQIMKKYRTLSAKRPRILGLTPSLLNKRVSPSNIKGTAKRLERIMHSRLETASDLAIICKYVNKPKKFIVCAKNDGTVENLVLESLEKLRVFIEINTDFREEVTQVDPRKPILEAINRASATLRQVGSWCAMRGCLLWKKKLAKLAEEPFLGPKQRSALKTAEATFHLCSKMLGQKVGCVNSFAKLVGDSPQASFVSDRVRKLLEILIDYAPSKRTALSAKAPLSALVFVNERFIAFMINTLLKALVKWETEMFGHLKVDFLVDNNYPPCESGEEERKLANKKLELTLQRFRNGQLNVLVTTNVLEEGVDIRNCNLVIRFDVPVDFRSFVLSSGRARRENGAFYIISEERNYASLVNELENYSKIEEFIMDHYSSNEILKEEEIPKNVDELFPPYAVESPSGRAQVTLSGAIPLINRYCSKLPSDVFTRLVPHYEFNSAQQRDGKHSHFAQLLLPINSPLKECIQLNECGGIAEIEALFASKSLALMSVALEACKKLHQTKELSDQLTPTGKEIVTNLLGELEDDEEYLPYLLNKSGPTKRRRLYDRKTSKSLVGTLPALDSICIVYVIEMRLVKPISEENNPKKRRIIDPHEIDWAFGFLSCKELPSIPAFPVYQRQGEMLVKIRKANAPLLLTQELFQLVSLFHQHIFEDILRIARGGLAYSPEYSPIPLPIVPLKRVGPTDDDYELDRSHLRCDIRDHPTMPPEECRRNFSFDESRYADAVVMPWYRSEEQSAFYYVAEICGDQNPASPFPDPKFSSFNEYFTAKYQLKIFNQEQCLLDVDHTSARMNLLLPRSGSGKVSKKPLDPSQRQILVPELVNIHPFSAALWSMIIALPTILYRTNSLLLADEFRVKIMEDALKMSECAKTPSAEWKWGPLCYNVSQANGCVGEAEQQKPHQQIIIKNLDQLKKINQEEEGLKKNGSGTATKERTGKHGESNLEEFEIGIWDPEDLVTPSVERIHSPQVVNSLSAENGHLSNGLRNGHRELSSTREEEISELIAIGSDYSIHSYGDLSDEDEVAAEYANCTFLMHNKVSDIDLGDIEHAGLRERGWGENDAEDFVTNNIQIENDFLPLTISRNNPDINIVTLMDDLQKNFSGDLGGVLSNCGESQQAKQNPRVHNKTEPSSHKQPKPVLLINEVQLCLDPMHAMDELDKRLEEDVVGEEFFYWDDQDAVMKLEEFDRIDENTKRPDSPECVDFLIDNQHFEVTAPDISDWMQFSFMHNKLAEHPHGVSPVLLLQALTTSSASDGINLERLETIGDSFLKMAVTDYLYHTHPEQHEGKLSFARSKEVSNSRLFYLGRQRNIPVLMETAKFDPHVNWLPPCYASTSEFHAVNPLDQNDHEEEVGEIPQQSVIDEKKVELTGWGTLDDDRQHYKCENGVETITFPQEIKQKIELDLPPLPYNMLTQQWISDKSIADAVEALIGAHLIQLGQEAVLKFMNWLGVRVLTKRFCVQPQPLDTHSRKSLLLLYNKFDFSKVEDTIGYKFADKGFLIQAFTHASYFNNRVTGCYQRLEFLGDAILDYMITRFLFEHRKQYSPGVLTDLRSALVNNTIFASLAVKYNFHKHFIMLCPPLFQMIEKFVNFCKQKDFLHCANFDDEIFMITEDEIDEGHEEDVEVPKAMGDIFESLAGAVYLDCGMDLDIVWRVFYGLMRDVIEKCCVNPPQSPVRELFERKNCKAKFAKLERKLETGKVRVTVTVNENLHFTGMGRGYRIAKCTAAKRALQHLRKLDAAKSKKDAEKKAIGAI